jgi:hypothetical protein
MPDMILVMFDVWSLISICGLTFGVGHMDGRRGDMVVGSFVDVVQIRVGDVRMIDIGDILMSLVCVVRMTLLCGVPIRVGDIRVSLLCGCDGQIHVVGCLLLTTFTMMFL